MMKTIPSVCGQRRNRYHAFGFAALTTLLFGCNFQLFDAPTATAHRSVTVEYRDGAPIEIRTRNGYIHVSHDGAISEVVVEADIRCGGTSIEQAEERAENCQLLATYSDSGALMIEPAFLESLHPRDGAKLQVKVPSGVDLSLRTSNGEIAVLPVQGSTIESLDAETSNGAMNAIGMNGNATLVTSNGPIRVLNVGGALVARTSNGPITASNVTGELQADTSNGPIMLELQGTQSGPIQAQTSNAPITAKVASGFDSRVEFRTSNGSIVVRDPQGIVRDQEISRTGGFVVVGEGASTSRLSTSNAKIVVHVD